MVHDYPLAQGLASERFAFKGLREVIQTFRIDFGFTIP
jgi:hypothetical protein